MALGLPRVPLIAIGSLLLIWNSLEGLDDDAEPADTVHSQRRRTAWSVLAAVGVLAISVSGQRAVSWWPVLLVGGLALTWTYAPRLLPPGTWRGRPGLPSVIATRSLINAGYFGVEAYVPLSLVVHRGLSATQAGIVPDRRRRAVVQRIVDGRESQRTGLKAPARTTRHGRRAHRAHGAVHDARHRPYRPRWSR